MHLVAPNEVFKEFTSSPPDQKYFMVVHFRSCLSRLIWHYSSQLYLNNYYYFFLITVDVRVSLSAPRLIPRGPKVNDLVNLQWPWGDSNCWPLGSKPMTEPTELPLSVNFIWIISNNLHNFPSLNPDSNQNVYIAIHPTIQIPFKTSINIPHVPTFHFIMKYLQFSTNSFNNDHFISFYNLLKNSMWWRKEADFIKRSHLKWSSHPMKIILL